MVEYSLRPQYQELQAAAYSWELGRWCSQKGVHQLLFQAQIISPEDTHTSNFMWIQQVIFGNKINCEFEGEWETKCGRVCRKEMEWIKFVIELES